MRKTTAAIYEARIEDLKAAHEARVTELRRVIDVLAEQVEYLRMQIGRPSFSRTTALNPSDQPSVVEGFDPFMSEEEEELRARHQAGRITDADLGQALAAAGLRNTDIEIDPS